MRVILGKVLVTCNQINNCLGRHRTLSCTAAAAVVGAAWNNCIASLLNSRWHTGGTVRAAAHFLFDSAVLA
jgi:hypothetical protein